MMNTHMQINKLIWVLMFLVLVTWLEIVVTTLYIAE